MTKLATLLWNAHAGAPSQASRVVTWLDRWSHDHEVQRIVLTEASGCRPALKAWAHTNGFRLYQEQRIAWDRGRPKPEHGDTAVLIRRKGRHAVKVRRQWVAAMSSTWKVIRYQITHEPRRHRRIVLQVDGKRLRTSAEHWPTYGRDNMRAWQESYASAARFLGRKQPALVDGDLNSSQQQAQRLATDVGGIVRGNRPDWCITTATAARTVVLGSGGSDHDALLVTVTL